MTWIIIILILLVIGALLNGSSSKNNYHYLGSSLGSIKPYHKAKLNYNVKGIWANEQRIETFRKIKVGDILFIRIDEHNHYDQNALGIYTRSGILVGYIKRNQRKLIKSVRANLPSLVKVIEHEEFFSQPRQLMVYRLGLEIWIGYPQEDLDKEKERFIQFYASVAALKTARQEIVEIRKELSTLEKTNPELTLIRLESASKTILQHNPHVHEFFKEKILFNE